MDVKVRCKDDKYTRHYKADKVLYCNNGKYRFVNVIVGNFVSSFHLDDIVEFEEMCIRDSLSIKKLSYSYIAVLSSRNILLLPGT